MKFTTATVLAFVAAVSADAVPEPEYSSTEPVYDPTYVDPPVYPTDYPTDYPVTYDPTYPTSTYDPAYPTTTPCTTSTDYPVDPVYPTYPPKYPSKEPIYPTTTPCTTSTDYPVYPEYPVSDYYPVYTTKVIDKYTTYCPYPTTYEHDGKKYEVTTPGYITLEGPVTVTYPVYTKSYVECHNCANATKPTSAYKPIATAGAGKTVAFSGAALGLAMAVAAFL